ncbi:VCBS repeat-containing protein [Streptomyces sp. M19]
MGDIDGDGKDDVVIGTGFSDGPDEMQLRTYPGTADGLGVDNPVDWEGDRPGGEPVRLTDLDGDGHADLVLGDTDAESSDGYNGAGAVTVVKGTENWLTAEGQQTFSLDTEGVPGEAEGADWFGASVATADYNGDESPTWRSACRTRRTTARWPCSTGPGPVRARRAPRSSAPPTSERTPASTARSARACRTPRAGDALTR